MFFWGRLKHYDCNWQKFLSKKIIGQFFFRGKTDDVDFFFHLLHMSECDCSCVSEYTNYLASVFALEIILQMSGHFSHRRRSRKDANNMSIEVAVIPGGPIREPPPTQPCTQMKEREKIVSF